MIMIIVISHFIFFKQTDFEDIYSDHIRNADLAVDFFFMLSGFGMMLGYLRKYHQNEEKVTLFTSINYAIRHIRKIYPVFLTTILFGFCWNIGESIILSQFSISYFLSETLKLIVNIPLCSQLTGMATFVHAFNGVTWFLSSLFIIYITSPLVMNFLQKHTNHIIKNLLCIFLCIVTIIFFIFVFQKIENKYPFLDCLRGTPYIRIFTVIIGMNLALIFCQLKDKVDISIFYANFSEILITFMNIIWFFARNSLEFSRRYKIFIDIILCISLIFIFSFDSGIISVFFKSKIMKKLGNISMWIFLVHYPLIVYFNDRTPLANINTIEICILKSIIIIIVSIAIAFLIEHYYSKPKVSKIDKIN